MRAALTARTYKGTVEITTRPPERPAVQR
jgi:hypothetical protein